MRGQKKSYSVNSLVREPLNLVSSMAKNSILKKEGIIEKIIPRKFIIIRVGKR